MRFIDFSEVRRLLPLPRLVNILGWRVLREGVNSQRCVCPIHGGVQGKGRDCRILETVWYCHRCKRGGDVIDFFAALNSLNVADAAHELCKLLKTDPPYLPRRPRSPRRPRGNREEAR